MHAAVTYSGAQARMPAGGALDGAGEIFRRLRAGDDDAAAEHEAGHAVDAGFLGGTGFAFDAVDIGVAGKKAPHQIAVHTDVKSFLTAVNPQAEAGDYRRSRGRRPWPWDEG